MYRLLSFLFLFLFLQISPATQGQELEKYQQQIYQSYISGDMELWQTTLEQMEKLSGRQPTAEVIYNLLLGYYGLIGYHLGTDEKRNARDLLDKATELLEKLEPFPEYQSHMLALRGALYGFRIGLRPLRAVVLGPRSMRAIDRAMEIDPSNPTAHLEKANALFYAPSTFGGSKTEAITHYRRAATLMEKQQHPAHRWLYLSTLVALANAYTETGNKQMAISTLRKALRHESNFKWAKEELLPELLK
jgi:tetratricopeptide (TPR) repeat protein